MRPVRALQTQPARLFNARRNPPFCPRRPVALRRLAHRYDQSLAVDDRVLRREHSDGGQPHERVLEPADLVVREAGPLAEGVLSDGVCHHEDLVARLDGDGDVVDLPLLLLLGEHAADVRPEGEGIHRVGEAAARDADVFTLVTLSLRRTTRTESPMPTPRSTCWRVPADRSSGGRRGRSPARGRASVRPLVPLGLRPPGDLGLRRQRLELGGGVGRVLEVETADPRRSTRPACGCPA